MKQNGGHHAIRRQKLPLESDLPTFLVTLHFWAVTSVVTRRALDSAQRERARTEGPLRRPGVYHRLRSRVPSCQRRALFAQAIAGIRLLNNAMVLQAKKPNKNEKPLGLV